MSRSFGFLFLACCIVLVSVSGCQRRSADVISAESAPQLQIEHIGGEISAECIVTVFDDNGSGYVSQQRHTIYPEASAINIQATEPEGDFEWSLSDGVFTVVKGDSSKLPVILSSNEISEAIVLTIAARGGFLGDKGGQLLDPISIDGQMYQPMVIDGSNNKKIYRDVSSFDIDWVEIGNSKNNVLYAARNYNIHKFENTDKLMPTSIDIYNTDKNGRPLDRIMKIEYKSFGLVSR